MPGPRNPKRQKKLNALKEKKWKRTTGCKPEVEPVATPEVCGKVTPAPDVEEKDSVATQCVELDEVEGVLPRQPPVYDGGTGPRVRSMGEFLRSNFASEPTWNDELCAEFAQEEMLEMLRTVLPEEMALVREWHYLAGVFFMKLKWAVMKVRVAQQEPATFTRMSRVLEDLSDGRRAFQSTSRSRVTQAAAKRLSRAGGRAGDQRTLCALIILHHLRV